MQRQRCGGCSTLGSARTRGLSPWLPPCRAPGAPATKFLATNFLDIRSLLSLSCHEGSARMSSGRSSSVTLGVSLRPHGREVTVTGRRSGIADPRPGFASGSRGSMQPASLQRSATARAHEDGRPIRSRPPLEAAHLLQAPPQDCASSLSLPGPRKRSVAEAMHLTYPRVPGAAAWRRRGSARWARRSISGVVGWRYRVGWRSCRARILLCRCRLPRRYADRGRAELPLLDLRDFESSFRVEATKIHEIMHCRNPNTAHTCRPIYTSRARLDALFHMLAAAPILLLSCCYPPHHFRET